jgi:hypothetical protein
MTMPQLWIPSDDLLEHDPIALQKIESPFEPPDLEAHGIKLFDLEDDDANEAAAALVLASLDNDEATAAGEPGEADDDDEIDDPEDGEHVAGDV